MIACGLMVATTYVVAYGDGFVEAQARAANAFNERSMDVLRLEKELAECRAELERQRPNP
jgi:hypothetical protein